MNSGHAWVTQTESKYECTKPKGSVVVISYSEERNVTQAAVVLGRAVRHHHISDVIYLFSDIIGK
jgi:hypothetical protein